MHELFCTFIKKQQKRYVTLPQTTRIEKVNKRKLELLFYMFTEIDLAAFYLNERS